MHPVLSIRCALPDDVESYNADTIGLSPKAPDQLQRARQQVTYENCG